MSLYRTVIGIDPSLSATGIVALQRDGEPGAWRLVYRHTVRPTTKGSLVSRLDALDRDVRASVLQAICGRPEPLAAAAEDPSDFRVPGKSGVSQLIRFGAGVGVALLAAQRACHEIGLPLVTYGVNEWIPKVGGRRGGGWKHPMSHKDLLAQARHMIAGTVGATDDETMAAALALTHVLKVRHHQSMAGTGAGD